MLTSFQQIENARQSAGSFVDTPEQDAWTDYSDIVAEIVATTCGVSEGDLLTRSQPNEAISVADRISFLFDSLANENPIFVRAISRLVPSATNHGFHTDLTDFELTQLEAYLPAIVQAVYWDIHINRDRGTRSRLVSKDGEIYAGLQNYFSFLPINDFYENSPEMAYDLFRAARSTVDNRKKLHPFSGGYGEIAHAFTVEMSETLEKLLVKVYQYAKGNLPELKRKIVTYDSGYYVRPIAHAIGAGIMGSREFQAYYPVISPTLSLPKEQVTADHQTHYLKNTAKKFKLAEKEMMKRRYEAETILEIIVAEPVYLAQFLAGLERDADFAMYRPREISKLLEAVERAVSAIKLDADSDLGD